METITHSITINRPIEAVFAFVTDARNNIQWQASAGLKGSRQEPDGPVGVGTRIIETWNFMGRTSENVSEVTAYELNRKYTRSDLSGTGPIKGGDYLFEPAEEGTRWTSITQVRASGLFAIAEPLLASTLRKAMDANMAAAKALLERA